MTSKRKGLASKAKPKRQRAAKPDQSWVSASVRYADTGRGYMTTRSEDHEIVARAVQLTAYSAANLNATAAAAHTLRLYRPAGAKGLGKAKRVRDRKDIAWLGGRGNLRPGGKAVQLASAADDIEEVTDHPVLDALYRPTPFMVGHQWRWLQYFYAEASGRCFIYTGEASQFGPVSLYPLAPQYTRIEADKSDFIRSYLYGVEGGASAQRYEADVVIYHRERPHPFAPLHAMSWMHSVVGVTDLEAAAVQSEIARWNNGGIPGMAISYNDPTGKVTTAQVRQAEEEFNQRHRGVDKSGATLFLLNGTVAQYGPKPHEMQYVEGQRRVEEAIYRAAGIPEPVWKMGSSNRASAVAADPQWMGSTILPKLNALADTLTEFLLPKYAGTEGWWFAYENPVRDDIEATTTRAVSMYNAGLLTGNQALALAGQERGDEALDVLRYNGVPIEKMGEQSFGFGASLPPPPQPAVDDVEAEDETEDEPEEETPEDGEVAEKSLRVTKAGPPSSRETERILASFQRALERWYKGALANAVRPDGTVDLSGALQPLGVTVDTHVGQLFQAGADEGARQIGLDSEAFNIDRADVTAYLNAEGGRLISSVSESLAAAVGNRVASMTASGANMADIQASVADMGIADWSAERIVRTEWSFAYNEGARRVWADEGVEGKDFLLAGGPCPICEAAHEQHGGSEHPIDQPYYRAGDSIVAGGKTYTFQRDMQGPPWHPNCRCTLVPGKVRAT